MHRIFCLILVALSMHCASVASAELTVDQLEAKEIIHRYFDALKQGDTGTIQNLLGGDLLTVKKSLLNNPTYPDYLINMYKDTVYEITAMKSFKDGLIAVDAMIIMNDQESMQTRYFLQRAERENTTTNQLYIFAEGEAE